MLSASLPRSSGLDAGDEQARPDVRGVARESELGESRGARAVVRGVLGARQAERGARARLELLDRGPGGHGRGGVVRAKLCFGEQHLEIDVARASLGEPQRRAHRLRGRSLDAQVRGARGVRVLGVEVAQTREQHLALRMDRRVFAEAQLAQGAGQREVSRERLHTLRACLCGAERVQRALRLGKGVATERLPSGGSGLRKQPSVVARVDAIADPIRPVRTDGGNERERPTRDRQDQESAEHPQRPARAVARLDVRHSGLERGGRGGRALLRDGSELHVFFAAWRE